jgi:hypothetical protein
MDVIAMLFLRFTIWLVPVWINLTPSIDLEAKVDVKLEASAEVKLTQDGHVTVQAWYEDGFGGSADAGFSQSLTTSIGGKATATAEAAAVASMRVLIYGVVGGTIGLRGGLKWEAEAVTVENLLLLVPPFHFTQFDVDAFVEAPVTLLAILPGFSEGTRLDEDLGNLFEKKCKCHCQ